jgi:hypothetical protein
MTNIILQEPGPWNNAYFSTGRIFFVYTLVCINVFVGARELLSFLRNKRNWDNWTCVQHTIFWLAAASSISKYC